MALKIVWTPKADRGLNNVLRYLDQNSASIEILKLEQNLKVLLDLVRRYPEICTETKTYKNLHKGLIDKNNYIIYFVHPKEKLIEIINFKGTE